MTPAEKKQEAIKAARRRARIEFSIYVLGVVLLSIGLGVEFGPGVGVGVVGAAVIVEMKSGDQS